MPFLEFSDTHKIPLLRKIAEVNFSPLNLAQIKSKNNQLYFKYETPLHLCEPYKIYYVLEEICHNADNMDDELLDLFDVTLLHQPIIKRYDEEVLEKSWGKFQAILEEAFNYIQYFEEKRMEYFNWDIINITLKKIEYILAPNGKLRTCLLYTSPSPRD